MDEIWIDGGFAAAPGAVAANDRGLTLPDGVFDTSLVLGGTVFRQEAHLDRLMAAAASLAIPADRAALEMAMTALAERRGDGAIRLTVTRGPGARGLAFPADPQPTLIGTTAPLAAATMFAPLRLHVSDIRRNETSPTARVKSLAYLDSVLANHAARQVGADEALFLNGAGRIACSALANVFVLAGSEIVTPPRDDGVLDGIVRGWILEPCRHVRLVGRREAPVAPGARGRSDRLDQQPAPDRTGQPRCAGADHAGPALARADGRALRSYRAGMRGRSACARSGAARLIRTAGVSAATCRPPGARRDRTRYRPPRHRAAC